MMGRASRERGSLFALRVLVCMVAARCVDVGTVLLEKFHHIVLFVVNI